MQMRRRRQALLEHEYLLPARRTHLPEADARACSAWPPTNTSSAGSALGTSACSIPKPRRSMLLGPSPRGRAQRMWSSAIVPMGRASPPTLCKRQATIRQPLRTAFRQENRRSQPYDCNTGLEPPNSGAGPLCLGAIVGPRSADCEKGLRRWRKEAATKRDTWTEPLTDLAPRPIQLGQQRRATWARARDQSASYQ